jgi:competence protein ComEA
LFRILEPKLCCNPVVEQKQEPDPGFEKLNVNTASAKEIHDVTGMNMTACYSITGYRKKNGRFDKLEDLLKVSNIFPGTLKKIEHLLEV